LSKNANIFAKFFGENILKIITSVPDDFVKKMPKILPNPFLLSKAQPKYALVNPSTPQKNWKQLSTLRAGARAGALASFFRQFFSIFSEHFLQQL
jgi:hypothetical protein